MAIFHLTTKVVSRGKGQSVLAAAAYRSGQALTDHQTGEVKRYEARKERIVFEGVFAPKDAPEWAKDREQLWNAVETFEKRKNSRLAREIEIALPHELTDQQREWLVKDFVREQFVRKGFAVDVAIHAPDKDSDARNYHAHLLVTTRSIGPDGFGQKERGHNSKGQLKEWREQWAHLCNRHLEWHGHEARIDHRSHAERGIDREPTIHAGYAAKQMDARGAQSDRMDELRGIMARNDAIRVLREGGRFESGRDSFAGDPAAPSARDERSEDPAPRGAFTNRLLKQEPPPPALDLPAPKKPEQFLDHGDFADALPPESGSAAPPPRDDRHDPHAEDFEREDERGLPAAPHGVRLGGGAIDAISDGIGAMADKAADVLLSLFSSGKEKPVAEEKEQQKGMTAAQAWQKATETSRAENARREKDTLDRAEQQKHRPLQPNERDEALRRGDRER